MTVPRYIENPLIIKSSMLCPGISQITKRHHLTLYKGQVWRKKPYLELCDHNVFSVAYDPYWEEETAINGELNFDPYAVQWGFFLDWPRLPDYSEMIHSFAEMTNITSIIFHPFDGALESLDANGVDYHIVATANMCDRLVLHKEWCTPHHTYFPLYSFTKEGLKI